MQGDENKKQVEILSFQMDLEKGAGQQSIESIFQNDDTDKTIEFKKALQTVFTSEDDPVRKNLWWTMELRNQATHTVISVMPPQALQLFQAGILNYERHIKEWFERSLCERIPDGMMFLVAEIDSSQFSLQPALISRRISKDAARRLAEWQNSVRKEVEGLNERDLHYFTLPIEINIAVVKNPKKSDIIATWEGNVPEGDLPVAIRYQRPIDRWPFSWKQVWEAVKKELPDVKRTQFNNVMREHKIKEHEAYSYYNFRTKEQEIDYKNKGTLPLGVPSIYNQDAINFILDKLKENRAH